MLSALPWLSTIQLAADAMSVSPKIRLPIVRGVSSVTVVSAINSSVANVAVRASPLPMMPSCHFELSLHSPFVSLIHVLSPASRRV